MWFIPVVGVFGFFYRLSAKQGMTCFFILTAEKLFTARKTGSNEFKATKNNGGVILNTAMVYGFLL